MKDLHSPTVNSDLQTTSLSMTVERFGIEVQMFHHIKVIPMQMGVSSSGSGSVPRSQLGNCGQFYL